MSLYSELFSFLSSNRLQKAITCQICRQMAIQLDILSALNYSTTSAMPSLYTWVLAVGITWAATCMQKYSFSAANGSLPDEPFMMWRLVSKVAFL